MAKPLAELVAKTVLVDTNPFMCLACLQPNDIPLRTLGIPDGPITHACTECTEICHTCGTVFLHPGQRQILYRFLGPRGSIPYSMKDIRLFQAASTQCPDCIADTVPCTKCGTSTPNGCPDDDSACRACRLQALCMYPLMQWKPAQHVVHDPSDGEHLTSTWCTECYLAHKCPMPECTHARESCHGLCRECEESTNAFFCTTCTRFTNPLSAHSVTFSSTNTEPTEAAEAYSRELDNPTHVTDPKWFNYHAPLWSTQDRMDTKNELDTATTRVLIHSDGNKYCRDCYFMCHACRRTLPGRDELVTCTPCKRSYCPSCAAFFFPPLSGATRISFCFYCDPRGCEFDKRTWERYMQLNGLRPRIPRVQWDRITEHLGLVQHLQRLKVPEATPFGTQRLIVNPKKRKALLRPTPGLAKRDVNRTALYDKLEEDDSDYVPTDDDEQTTTEEDDPTTDEELVIKL